MLQFRDLYQSPSLHLAGMVAAQAAGIVVASAPTAILTKYRLGYDIFTPVSSRSGTPGPPPRQSLLGMVMDAGAALANVVGASPAAAALNIRIVDTTATPADASVLLFSAGGAEATSTEIFPATAPFVFMNRNWSVVVAPLPAFVAASLDPGLRTVLAVGIPLVVATCKWSALCA